MFNFPRSSPAIPPLSITDVMDKVASGEVLLVDVRETSELQTSGTVKGSIHIPVALIARKADPKGVDFDMRFAGKDVAVFCASGGRSGMAVQALGKLGYRAINLGGFEALAQAGVLVSRTG